MEGTNIHGLRNMEIVFTNKDKETISSWKLSRFVSDDEDVKGVCPVNYHPAYKKPIGTLLIDVLAADFNNQDSFNTFFDKWGLAALVDYSAAANNISMTDHSEEEYKSIMDKIWHESESVLRLAQKEMEKLVYYCLDLDGPTWLIDLSNIQRLYLVQNKKDLPEIEPYINGITSKFYIRAVNPDFDRFVFKEEGRHLPENELARMIKDNEFEVEEIITSGNLADICYIEFKKLLLGNYSMRKCKNCGYYFIPTGRIDTEYCDRVIKIGQDGTEKTCKDIGAMTRYVKKVEKDPITSEYRRVYKTMHARTYASGPSRIEPPEWEAWKSEAANKLQQAKQKKITPGEFKEWLEKSKGGLK